MPSRLSRTKSFVREIIIIPKGVQVSQRRRVYVFVTDNNRLRLQF